SLDQRRAFAGVQWIWVRNDANPFDQWIPKGDSRPESVKERQRRENCVRFFCVEQFPKLRDISHDVTVTHDRAFGFASGSACKKQHCFGVPTFSWNVQQPQKQTRG